MNILFLSRWYPYPANNGSKIRIFNILKGLAQRHQLSLISFSDEQDGKLDRAVLQSMCKDVKVVPWKPFNPNSMRARMGFFSSTPRSVLDTYSIEMEGAIRASISRDVFDLLIASEIDMAHYYRSFRGINAILEDLELGHYFEQFAFADNRRSHFRHRLTWEKYKRYLSKLLSHIDCCTVVSEKERQLINLAVPEYDSVGVIQNFVDLTDYGQVQAKPRPETIIFCGSFSYYPNYEGMQWFIGEVYPRVKNQFANINLTITGNHGNRPLPDMSNVNLTGYVDDVQELIASSWLSIAPIWSGSGTRLKILEAMALRTPVVTTTKGAEGLEVEHGQHLLIADRPEEFSDMVVCLLKDQSLRGRLVENAHQLIKDKYDKSVVIAKFLELVGQFERN